MKNVSLWNGFLGDTFTCFFWKVIFITKWSQKFRNVSNPKMLGLRENQPELLEQIISEIKVHGMPRDGVYHMVTPGGSQLLCAPAFSAFPQRSWKPSFASKAWENRRTGFPYRSAVEIHAHGPTVMCWKFTGNFSQGGSSTDMVCCLKICDQLLWVTI